MPSADVPGQATTYPLNPLLLMLEERMEQDARPKSFSLMSWDGLKQLTPSILNADIPRGVVIEPLASRSTSSLAIRMRLKLLRRLGRAGPIATAANGLVLWRDPEGNCPFSERIWFALEAMGIKYVERAVDLAAKDEGFERMAEWHSPTGKATVPAMSTPDGAHVLWESMDILHWLSGCNADDVDSLGTGSLVCGRFLDDGSVVQRARHTGSEQRIPNLVVPARMLHDLNPIVPSSGTQLEAVERLISAMGRDPTPDGNFAHLPRDAAGALDALDALDSELSFSTGGLFGGNRLSVADCALAPFLERYASDARVRDHPELSSLAERSQGRRWPNIARWYASIRHTAPYKGGPNRALARPEQRELSPVSERAAAEAQAGFTIFDEKEPASISSGVPTVPEAYRLLAEPARIEKDGGNKFTSAGARAEALALVVNGRDELAQGVVASLGPLIGADNVKAEVDAVLRLLATALATRVPVQILEESSERIDRALPSTEADFDDHMRARMVAMAGALNRNLPHANITPQASAQLRAALVLIGHALAVDRPGLP